MRTHAAALFVVLCGCTKAAPAVDPTYVLDTDRFAVSMGVSGDELRTRYAELAKECLQTETRIFEFHKKLGRKTYNNKGALDAIPALCKDAIAKGRDL